MCASGGSWQALLLHKCWVARQVSVSRTRMGASHQAARVAALLVAVVMVSTFVELCSLCATCAACATGSFGSCIGSCKGNGKLAHTDACAFKCVDLRGRAACKLVNQRRVTCSGCRCGASCVGWRLAMLLIVPASGVVLLDAFSSL
ncbi:hypothetical protein COO60DRAFT_588868 [Scenedesmus sp. NREL 46B-D3]|nr:hypothetical protein COO60DRAFT_588868 [Scenedesmus sp. NREL 46B-D3]